MEKKTKKSLETSTHQGYGVWSNTLASVPVLQCTHFDWLTVDYAKQRLELESLQEEGRLSVRKDMSSTSLTNQFYVHRNNI